MPSTPYPPPPYSLTPIAHIRSCYPERFGIPRQPGLVPTATAQIVFPANETNKLALRGIDAFSHLWVIFWFHGQDFGPCKPLVRPPRLGGNKYVGVYATRSPNRPNPIGLSAVTLDRLESTHHEILLHIHGVDLLDGTPVLDLKPYIPYADAITEAHSAWAIAEAAPLPVQWSVPAATALETLWAQGLLRDLEASRQLIAETIAQDPRPGYERHKDGQAGQRWNMRIAGLDVFWTVEAGTAWVTELTQA